MVHDWNNLCNFKMGTKAMTHEEKAREIVENMPHFDCCGGDYCNETVSWQVLEVKAIEMIAEALARSYQDGKQSVINSMINQTLLTDIAKEDKMSPMLKERSERGENG